MNNDDAVCWTLSGFGDEIHPDPARQTDVLLAIGAHHIEVRSADGINVVDMGPAQTTPLLALLNEKGFAVSAVAFPIGKVDVALPALAEVERLRRVIAVAHDLGTRYVRVFSFFRGPRQSPADIRSAAIERMSLLAQLAETSGIVLLHENEKDIYGDTPERVLDLMESVASPALRVAWDSANFVQVGVKPFTEGYALLRPYLEYVQVKDAQFTTGEVVAAGEGDGELLNTLRALRDDGYTGFVFLEPHLASTHALGGFSGPEAFGAAARAFRRLTDSLGVNLA